MMNNLQLIQQLYVDVVAKRAAAAHASEFIPSKLPATPKFFATQGDMDQYEASVAHIQEVNQQHLKALSGAEAIMRTSIVVLLEVMPAHVWVYSGSNGMWIAKQCSDWPQDPARLVESVTTDPATLPQLKLQHVNPN